MTEPKASRPFMPGYGISEGEEGLLPWSWAVDRLENSHNYWIATTRADGRPHVMPVWGVWLDGRYIFSTARTSRKASNLADNASCVVCTEGATEAVIVEGGGGGHRQPRRLATGLGGVQREVQLGPDGREHVRGQTADRLRLHREAAGVRGLGHALAVRVGGSRGRRCRIMGARPHAL